MFSWMWRRKYGPVRLIFKFFGMDTAKNHYDDIDPDMFRMCIRPKSASPSKRVFEDFTWVFCKILGVNKSDLTDSLEEYFRLKAEMDDLELQGGYFSEHRKRYHTTANDFRDLISNDFTFEVTEDQRETIMEKANGKRAAFMVVLDEYEDLERMAKDQVSYERSIRLEREFIEKARAKLDEPESIKEEEFFDDDED